MEIKSLENIGLDSLYLAFHEAFKDYELQLTKSELFTMLKRRGFVPGLSFGAFVNGRLVSFTFNGIGFFNGIKTAYDTGTGTIDVYRGKGLATAIFKFSLPRLRKNGIGNYLLEVLQHNTKAVSVYKKLGFEVSREFNYFIQDAEKITLPARRLPENYSIQPMESPDFVTMEKCMDFIPSWQNSFDSVSRNLEDFKILGAYIGKQLTGFSVLEPKTGDLTLVAVSKDHRRKGIASGLVKETLKYNRAQSFKVINTPVEDISMTEFLRSLNMSVTGKQYEMTRKV